LTNKVIKLSGVAHRPQALLKAKEEREKQVAQYTFQIHKRVGYREIEIVRLYCIWCARTGYRMSQNGGMNIFIE
jgi:hypothetical protein